MTAAPASQTLNIAITGCRAEDRQALASTIGIVGESLGPLRIVDLDPSDPPAALILGPGLSDRERSSALAAIGAQPLHVPLIQIGDGRQPDGRDAQPRIFHRLDWPVSAETLAIVVRQCRDLQTTSGRRPARNPELFRCLRGASAAIAEVRELITKVARFRTTVLIQGESGTGKEVVARNIHYAAFGDTARFVPVNCGAIPSELLESELFGYRKGAFTGAASDREGRFHQAAGGTLFLDEIGDMPMPMQVKLLRVLQERRFEPVGAGDAIPTDARVIAATHANLAEQIRNGDFREDLYYRLNIFPIRVPALRERREDLPLLVADIAERLLHEQGIGIRFSDEALQRLQCYDWPGNVRELANLVERLAVLNPNRVIRPGDLPRKFHGDPAPARRDDAGTEARLPDDGVDLRAYVAGVERALIEQALGRAQGVVTNAARLLGLGRTTLAEKMRRLGVEHTGAD